MAPRCVIFAGGELDLATRDQLFVALTKVDHQTVVVDLADITFMDCCGYGALVAARHVVEGGGRTLTISGQTGQPARLFELIATVETSKRADGWQARPRLVPWTGNEPAGRLADIGVRGGPAMLNVVD